MIDNYQFEDLYKKFYAPVYKYCLVRLSFDRDSAADAADNVFMTLYEKRDGIDPGERIGMWLYRAADNYIKKAYLKAKRYYSMIDGEIDPDDPEDSELFSSWDRYFENETPEEDMIKKVGESVPEEYRELFRLRYVEKKTLNEIAERLGVPYSTLRRRISKMDLEIRREIHKMLGNSDV